MNPFMHAHEHSTIARVSEAPMLTKHELLAQWGFTDKEIVSLLWLQKWYQMGGSDRALYEGGLRIFEVTVEAPGAIEAFSRVRAQMPDDVLLGAGTVLDAATVALVIAAGARFVVSPVLLKDMCDVALAHGVPCVLGAMTPSEVHAAYRSGCEVVKVFPASAVGPGFIRELKGPLGFIPLYPTGGITLENADTFLEAGAIALGVGSALVKKAWVERGDWDSLRGEAAAWAQFRRV